MAKLLVINGPNLNLLGSREPKYYGRDSLGSLETHWKALAKTRGHELVCEQSNAEHVLIDLVQNAPQAGFQIALINPGAFAHTSIALRDAFLASALPFVEIHISNLYTRESFRHHSYLSDIALGTISGLGTYGYELALYAAIHHVEK